MLSNISVVILYEIVQYNECLISIEGTDDLVL